MVWKDKAQWGLLSPHVWKLSLAKPPSPTPRKASVRVYATAEHSSLQSRTISVMRESKTGRLASQYAWEGAAFPEWHTLQLCSTQLTAAFRVQLQRQRERFIVSIYVHRNHSGRCSAWVTTVEPQANKQVKCVLCVHAALTYIYSISLRLHASFHTTHVEPIKCSVREKIVGYTQYSNPRVRLWW